MKNLSNTEIAFNVRKTGKIMMFQRRLIWGAFCDPGVWLVIATLITHYRHDVFLAVVVCWSIFVIIVLSFRNIIVTALLAHTLNAAPPISQTLVSPQRTENILSVWKLFRRILRHGPNLILLLHILNPFFRAHTRSLFWIYAISVIYLAMWDLALFVIYCLIQGFAYG